MVAINLYPLTAEAVETTFFNCLPEVPIDPDAPTIDAQGIQMKITFSEALIEKYREAIESFLSQLPMNFRKTHGGGWSFLNMCLDNEGNHWADLHRTMDMLVCLGKAIGKLTTSDPQWNMMMPGGMPYVFIDL